MGCCLNMSHVCVGGTHMWWTGTMWRSCAKLSGRPNRSKANPPALWQRHSREKDSKVSKVYIRWIFCLPNYSAPLIWLRCVHPFAIDIEDLENWHGKPIPKDKVDVLLNDLQSQIQVPNKTLCPELPSDDTAPADLSPISLPSPPAYKKGEKVPLLTTCVLLIQASRTVFFFLSWSICSN